MKTDYQEFIRSKQRQPKSYGFDIAIDDLNPHLKPWQAKVVQWAVRRGRAALFQNCGLGKTIQQLCWAEIITRHTGKPVILHCPVGVRSQTIAEARKFEIGVPCYIADESSEVRDGAGIAVVNYEKLHRFDASVFGGVVLDESSVLKNFTGKVKRMLCESYSNTPYRLACTATPAPNDHMELGNQAEFLGVMGMNEMLAMFFTHDGGDTSKWRLKGHGERKFWEWMATWAVTITKPSDIGYSDEGYDLPPLRMHEHMVASPVSEDSLLVDIAQTLTERRAAKNATVESRVAEVAKLCNGNDDQWLVWCHTNNESELLRKAIDGAVEVKGSDSIDHKEKSIEGFIDGSVRVMVSKPSMFGFGLNLQNCKNMAFVGLDDSYEQMYQAIRRCWRFGQTQPVDVHIVSAEALGAIRANIERKESQMEQMQLSMVDHMRDATFSQLTSLSRKFDR